jgi:hypothetical protein
LTIRARVRDVMPFANMPPVHRIASDPAGAPAGALLATAAAGAEAVNA